MTLETNIRELFQRQAPSPPTTLRWVEVEGRIRRIRLRRRLTTGAMVVALSVAGVIEAPHYLAHSDRRKEHSIVTSSPAAVVPPRPASSILLERVVSEGRPIQLFAAVGSVDYKRGADFARSKGFAWCPTLNFRSVDHSSGTVGGGTCAVFEGHALSEFIAFNAPWHYGDSRSSTGHFPAWGMGLAAPSVVKVRVEFEDFGPVDALTHPVPGFGVSYYLVPLPQGAFSADAVEAYDANNKVVERQQPAGRATN